ncbi:hypothetical protein A9Q89_12460 [Gammaproteobacteria bacterium 53_120_T64]|nr:hypothetical protein A9Q89_12460 [Gammaproteobacteria bacterium 53_120_T64]
MKAYRRTTITCDYVAANKQLTAHSKALVLENTGLKLDSDIDSRGDRCKAMARKAERVLHRTYHSRGEQYALNAVRQIVEDTGIKFPLDEKYTEDEMLAAFARVIEHRLVAQSA